jgi:hypothetical protein
MAEKVVAALHEIIASVLRGPRLRPDPAGRPVGAVKAHDPMRVRRRERLGAVRRPRPGRPEREHRPRRLVRRIPGRSDRPTGMTACSPSARR